MKLSSRLTACLLLALAGCSKPISDVKDLVVKPCPKVSMRFVYLPALDRYMGKYEVSNGEYRCFKTKHDSGQHEGLTLNKDSQPVVQVSWEDAKAFAEWLTKTAGGNTWRFRLPNEQEWMMAASCGRPDALYPWGDGDIPARWNYYGRENPKPGQKLDRDDGYRVSSPVQKSGANAWGLYGMGGNVWEWCEDADDAEGKTRVLKGASWADCAPLFLSLDRRSSYTADYRSSSIGFRLIAEAVAVKTGDEPAATPEEPSETP